MEFASFQSSAIENFEVAAWFLGKLANRNIHIYTYMFTDFDLLSRQ